MNARRIPLWILLGVALVAALVVGSGALSSSPPTAAQRAAAIESVIRCPSCEDLSVATSSAPTAAAVRDTVHQQIAAGHTDGQIEDYLAARYGSAIVLDPPASGWSLLVWLLPVLGGAVALGLLGLFLVRRRAIAATPRDEPVTDDPAIVEERRRFLVRSLADADAEFLAGDLSDGDYLALRQRDLARLAALGEAPARATASATATLTRGVDLSGGGRASGLLQDGVLGPARPDAPGGVHEEPGHEPRRAEPPATGARPGRSARSRWLLRAAVAAFAAALVVAVALFVTARQPGQTVTGNVPLTASQQLARTLDQAATDVDTGQLGAAAQVYQSVLAAHPDNEVALAQLGWLEYRSAGSSTSLLADARAKLERAVELDPGDYAARLYLGTVMLLHDRDAAGAVTEYRQFLADHPPKSVVQEAAPDLRHAYQQAGVPLPAGVG